MSKKQKLITAEEWSVEEHIKSLLTLRGFSKEKIINNRGLIGAIVEDMEEYAQAKVLEALEREFSKLDGIDFSLIGGIEYYETEVKPKYE